MTLSQLQAETAANAEPPAAEIVRPARIVQGFTRCCCPTCRSENLLIRGMSGTERLMVFLTGTRKYRCKDCGEGFRMPDRRRSAREAEGVAAALRGA